MSSFWQSKKVVVTGAAGMMGSRLCQFLLDEGALVTGMDDFSRGTTRVSGVHYLEFPYNDAVDGTGCLHAFAGKDVVFNLAAHVGGLYFNLKNQAEQYWGNMQLQSVPAIAAAQMNVPIFLQTSTVCVYAEQYNCPAQEPYGHLDSPEPANAGYAWAKRMGENVALWAYKDVPDAKVVIVRPTNCLHPDETIWVKEESDGTIHLLTAKELCEAPLRNKVTASNPLVLTCKDYHYEWSPVEKCWPSHPKSSHMLRIMTKYGRIITVTPDHPVLAEGGWTEAQHLIKGQRIALCCQSPEEDEFIPDLPIIPQVGQFDWAIAVPDPVKFAETFGDKIRQNIFGAQVYKPDKRYRDRHTQKHLWGYKKSNRFNLKMLPDIPEGSILYPKGSRIGIPCNTVLTHDLLWLLGFYIAKGCSYTKRGREVICLSSHEKFLKKAARVFQSILVGCNPKMSRHDQGPSLRICGRVCTHLIHGILGIEDHTARGKKLPEWVLSLPSDLLRYVLQGMYDGDGLKYGGDEGQFTYGTTSRMLAHQVLFILSRFGVTGSFSRTTSKLNGKCYGESFTVSAYGLPDWPIEKWERPRQRIQSRQEGEIVWANIKKIESVPAPEKVYDVSVPDGRNLVTGQMVTVHNCYGINDYFDERAHVIPALIKKFIQGNDKVTVYGGHQHREFIYADDVARGMMTVAERGTHGEAYNLGTNGETVITIGELACMIRRILDSKARIVYDNTAEIGDARRRTDSTKAQSIGWEYHVGLSWGLSEVIGWCLGGNSG